MNDLVSAILGLALVLAAVILTWRAARSAARTIRRLLDGQRPEDVLTFLVAGLITAIAAQGMFRFFGDKLQMPWWMQSLTFCVFELAQVACVLRARRNVRDPEIGTAGIDGVLVWVMSAVSAVLSSTDAHGWGAVARMVFPFAAAILWERGLSIERKRTRPADERVQSRLTVERLLVWLRLAEPSGRTASDVDVHRRLYRVARAAKRLRVLRQTDAGKWWRQRWALRRLDTAVAQADEHAGLSTNPARQEELLARIAVQFGADQLAEVSVAAPWAVPPRRSRLVLVRGPGAVREQLPAAVPPVVPGDVPERDTSEPPEDEDPPSLSDDEVERDAVPEDLRRLVARARKKFRGDLAAGRVPPIRDLKPALRIGTDRAREVQPYLAVPEGRRDA